MYGHWQTTIVPGTAHRAAWWTYAALLVLATPNTGCAQPGEPDHTGRIQVLPGADLQAAIDAAEPGATLVLIGDHEIGPEDWVVSENGQITGLTIDKALTIEGSASGVARDGGEGMARIHGGATSTGWGWGQAVLIRVPADGAVTFRDLVIDANGEGIDHWGQGDLTIENCVVRAAQGEYANPDEIGNGGRVVVSGGGQDDVTISIRDSLLVTGTESTPNQDWDVVGVFNGGYERIEILDSDLIGLTDDREDGFSASGGLERLGSTNPDEHIVLSDSTIETTGLVVQIQGFPGTVEITDNDLHGGRGGVLVNSNQAQGGVIADNRIEVDGNWGRGFGDGARHYSANLILGFQAAGFFLGNGLANPDLFEARGLDVHDNVLAGTPAHGIMMTDLHPTLLATWGGNLAEYNANVSSGNHVHDNDLSELQTTGTGMESADGFDGPEGGGGYDLKLGPYTRGNTFEDNGALLWTVDACPESDTTCDAAAAEASNTVKD